MCRLQRIAASWLLSMAAHGAACAADDAAARAVDCAIVVGQGRNPSAAEAAIWDRLNASFNTQVAATLKATGRRVFPIVLSVEDIDPVAIPRLMLQRATDSGCATIVETTVFANDEIATLSARLRVYPVLPVAGPRVGLTGFQIGEPVFASQRDYPLTQASLDRFRPAVLAEQMTAEYVEHSGQPGR